ncbi:glycosyltransferase family 39 protein, partial [Sphingomonas bacterium]|uniref:glycosyltransferase family 39 protein n=1 Tax=Sphingomonas bacterium TaxID=1895847 RepID=UPI001575365C
YEAHPPFYYSLLHVWSLLTGETLLARRLLGLSCGIATVVLAGVAAGRLPGRRRGRVVTAAVAITSLHPLLIAMSREVRPYPVMTAVYAAATLALLHLMTDSARGQRLGRTAVAGFFIAEALMLWLHDLGPFYGLAMSLALLAGVAGRALTRADWVRLAVGQGLVGLCYLPSLVITLGQASAWMHATWLHFDQGKLPMEIGTIYWNWNLLARVAGVLLAVGGVAVLARSAANGLRMASALLLLGVVPMALSVAISAAFAPVFLDRTLSPTAVPMALLCAAALGASGRWRWTAVALLAPVLVPATAQDLAAARGAPRQDWYGALRWLTPRVRAGDEVWTYPNDGALPLEYALHDRGRRLAVRPIPGPVPALGFRGTHPTGTMGVIALYPEDIARLAAGPVGHLPKRIWLVQVFGAEYDPHRVMVRELGRTRRAFDHWQSRGIEITGFGVWQSPR